MSAGSFLTPCLSLPKHANPCLCPQSFLCLGPPYYVGLCWDNPSHRPGRTGYGWDLGAGEVWKCWPGALLWPLTQISLSLQAYAICRCGLLKSSQHSEKVGFLPSFLNFSVSSMSNVGLELTALRSRVACSTHWASQALRLVFLFPFFRWKTMAWRLKKKGGVYFQDFFLCMQKYTQSLCDADWWSVLSQPDFFFF